MRILLQDLLARHGAEECSLTISERLPVHSLLCHEYMLSRGKKLVSPMGLSFVYIVGEQSPLGSEVESR